MPYLQLKHHPRGFSEISHHHLPQTHLASMPGLVSKLVRRTAASASFAQIILYLPLTLDIAGKDGFLALSAFLALYFSFTSTIHLIVRNTPFVILSQTLSSIHFLIVPTLLLCTLNLWSSTTSGSGAPSSFAGISYRTAEIPGLNYDRKAALAQSTLKWIALILKYLPNYWEMFLSFWSPLFMIFEGISTLLVIQAIGQIAKYFIEERGESYAFLFLLTSSTTYVLSAFCLRDAWKYAARDAINATLIGVSVTSVGFLSAIGFATRRTSVVEASLMMAYTVFQLYYLSDGLDPISFARSFKAPSPPLPPLILQSFSTVVYFLSHTLGQGIDFLQAASAALPLSAVVGLIYRITVLYLASRVVVAIRRAKGDEQEGTRLSQEEPFTRFMTVLLGYSKVIFISVYTHLLLLEDQGHHVWWRWFNIILTITLWGIELLISREDNDNDAVVVGMRLKEE